ncbi:MAG: flagellar protein FlaG [Gammaproteobacteria bacterium]|nr:flagellar protein FlaG [Gammaproteobacteria bacterium]
MANDISTSMRMAQMPSAAKVASQLSKLQTANTPNVNGQTLPNNGNELPQAEGNSSVNKVELREAVGQINDFVQKVQRDLSFSMDEGSGRTIIKVIDSDSGEVVRQIPNEQVLAMATYIREVSEASVGSEESPQGFLFSEST